MMKTKLSCILTLLGTWQLCAAPSATVVEVLRPVGSGTSGTSESHASSYIRMSRSYLLNVGSLETIRQGQVNVLRFEMPDGSRLDFTIDRNRQVVPGIPGTGIYRGRTTGSGRSAAHLNLVLHQGALAGSIRRNDGKAYQISVRPDGVGEIGELDTEAMPSCGNTPDEEIVELNPAPDRLVASAVFASTVRIDMLVAYTPEVLSRKGDAATVEALIHLAIDETNEAFDNSQIDVQVRLVHILPVTYTEVDSGTDLSRLRGTTDGYLDEVHAARDQYGADVVVLFADLSDACGRGYRMTSLSSTFDRSAFSVVDYACATGNYSFGHELGHNLGCHHAVGDASLERGGTILRTYAYGWRFTPSGGTQKRTIMAYSPGTRIQYFSNPDVSFEGTATGVALGLSDEAANAHVISYSAATAAAWRPTEVDPVTDLILVLRQTAEGLELSWEDTDAVLEQADTIDGNWKKVPRGVSPLVIAPSDPHKFYRLRSRAR